MLRRGAPELLLELRMDQGNPASGSGERLQPLGLQRLLLVPVSTRKFPILLCLWDQQVLIFSAVKVMILQTSWTDEWMRLSGTGEKMPELMGRTFEKWRFL